MNKVNWLYNENGQVGFYNANRNQIVTMIIITKHLRIRSSQICEQYKERGISISVNEENN